MANPCPCSFITYVAGEDLTASLKQQLLPTQPYDLKHSQKKLKNRYFNIILSTPSKSTISSQNASMNVPGISESPKETF
jgi:hypothetical protein